MTRKKIVIYSLIFVGIFSFVWLFSVSEEDANRDKEVIPASWNLNYKYNSRDPYGAYLFYEILKKNTPVFEAVAGNPYEVLRNKTGEVENMLLVVLAANYANYDFLWNQIDEFVSEGNKILFILDEDPERLETYYQGVFSVTSRSEWNLTTHFTHQDEEKYEYQLLDQFSPIKHVYKHFALESDIELEKDEYIDHPAAFTAYGEDFEFNFIVHEENEKGKPVFIEIPYGDGAIFIHRVPLAFTNMSLISEKQLDHLEHILSIIDFDGAIYNTHVVPKKPAAELPRISPIQFILENPSLKWAYYLMLAGILLFFLFNLKRKQNPMTILPPRENTTLEFADALSKIYYQKHNNLNIVKHKNRIFTTFIRTHYHIIPDKNRQEYARLISAKSGTELKMVEGLLNTMDRFMNLKEITDDQLVTLHKLLNNFYKHCK